MNEDKHYGSLWLDLAIGHVLKMPTGSKVTGEEVREALTAAKCVPHHASVWGALINRAVRDGVLVRTGQYAPPKDEKSNARLNRIYQRSELALRQPQKAVP